MKQTSIVLAVITFIILLVSCGKWLQVNNTVIKQRTPKALQDDNKVFKSYTRSSN